jgi:hypothetical protein
MCVHVCMCVVCCVSSTQQAVPLSREQMDYIKSRVSVGVSEDMYTSLLQGSLTWALDWILGACDLEWENFTYLFSLFSTWNLAFPLIKNMGNSHGNASHRCDFVTNWNPTVVLMTSYSIICVHSISKQWEVWDMLLNYIQLKFSCLQMWTWCSQSTWTGDIQLSNGQAAFSLNDVFNAQNTWIAKKTNFIETITKIF